MYFAKMHGLGNDFIVINNLDGRNIDYSNLARKICDRHFGIGADGLLVVEKSKIADIKMLIFNSDGSQAEMCGNGIRCFAKYVFEKEILKKEKMIIETLAGIMVAELKINNSLVNFVKINMGKPQINNIESIFNLKVDNLNYEINLNEKKFIASTLLMGVPHTIIYTEDIKDDDILIFGPQIEKLDFYPYKTNVNFVKVISNKKIKVKTWERGAGLTLACGTGSCASVVAAYLNGLTNNLVEVELEAGSLFIEYNDDVYMEGPAEFICEGNFFE
ncbi:diaminopimelate epimerase [Caloramator australicus]|uniref:Diaminopimelate epimerase n=1 Tax=Caloramator australicus RC3 TaxID=857293 RepID=I7KVT1_9CLOT|nr:diaminopimelate epimerase [Caloramator australicus]CCJ34174.1 Diaminopimelate epimerase [Caloramator australicus RC3]